MSKTEKQQKVRIGQYDVYDDPFIFRYQVTKVMKKTAEVRSYSRYGSNSWKFYGINYRFSIPLLLGLTKKAIFTLFVINETTGEE